MRVHELRVFRSTAEAATEVPHGSPFRVSLDVRDEEALRDLLNRHLYAAAARMGFPRDQAHLFFLEVREIDRQRVDRDVLFRWALPVLPDSEL